MRMRSAGCALVAALLAMACGAGEPSGPSASFSMSLALPHGLAITSLRLTVFDQSGTCTVDGDATGTPLPDLADLELTLGEPRTIRVSPGRRTFSVVAYDGADGVARGCAQADLEPGGSEQIAITIKEYPPPPDAAPDAEPVDAGPDAPLPPDAAPDAPPPPDAGPDAPPPPDAAPDAEPPDAMRPAGDTCGTVTALVAGTTVPVDLAGMADDESGTCAGGGASPDMVFTYTTTETRHITITVSSDFDAAVSIRSPTCVDEPSELNCVNAAAAGGSEIIDVRSQPAGTYFVVLDSADGSTGTGFITFTSVPPPPPGDSCAEVQTLATGTSTAQSLSTSYVDDAAGTCSGAGGRERVYTFNIIGAKHVNIATQATFAHSIYLRATSCTTGAEQGCQVSAFGGGTHNATLDFPNLAGGTYYLFVDGATAADAGTFDITLTVTTPTMPPANDTCASATLLAEGLSLPGTLDAANNDTSVSCAAGGNLDVFYRFDLATARQVTITLTSTIDTGLTLRSGTCGSPTELQCVNGTGAGEQIMIESLAAGSYYLVVEGIGGATGGFTIGFTTSAPIVRPPNDSCTGAITLTSGTPRLGEDLHDALDDADGTCGDTTSGDVVYTFTVPAGPAQTAQVSVTNAVGFDPVIYLRDSTCGGSQLGCSQASAGTSETLTVPGLAPGTYFVWIDAMGGEIAPASFDIALTLQTAGDACSLPITLSPGATLPFDFTGMLDQEDGTCAAAGSTPDMIFTYTIASAQHVTVTVTSTFDAAVSFRSSSCVDEPAETQCMNSAGAGGSEIIDVRTQPAGTYYVVVDSAGASGTGFITLSVAPPPPAGDSCAEVQTLATGTSTAQSLSTSYADDSAGTCSAAGARDRVYTFTTIASRHVNIATQATFAHSIYLRSTSCGSGPEQGCQVSTPGATHDATLDFPNLPGGTYYVFIEGGSATASGTFDITLTITAPTMPPANDTCAGATLLAEGLALPGTLDAALNDTAVSCVAGTNADVFYRFDLATNRAVTITLTAGFNTSLTLRSGTCGSPTEMQCMNLTSTGEQIIVDNLAAGSYTLVVEAVSGSTGTFNIGYTTAPPIIRPPNDACTGAFTLSSGTPRIGDNLHNGLDDADGSCGDTISGDVVYSFTIPPGPNQRARVTVSSAAGFDPVIYMRSGTCGGGEVGCAQTSSGPSDVLDMPSLPPDMYFVWVDALGGEVAPGTFDILLELLTAVSPPPNDLCAAAEPLADGMAETGSTVGATDDYSLSCLTFDSRDTVYSFDTSGLGARAVLVTTIATPGIWEIAAALRDAAVCTGTTDLSCVDDSFDSTLYINRPNLPGGAYDIVVDGTSGAVGDYSVRYDVRPADTTFGYWSIDTTGTYSSIVGTGTSLAIPLAPDGVLAPGDEWSMPITLPFAFDFYGTTYTSINASSNMFLSFATMPAGTENFVNDCPLNTTVPNDVIAPFWDDGISRASAGAQVLTLTEGTAPNRRFIIEYRNFDQLSCGSMLCYFLFTSVNHQAILYENGDIEFRYGPRTAPTADKNCTGGNGGASNNHHLGICATVGIEGQIAGPTTDTDQIQCNTITPPVVDGRVIYYVHPR